MEEQSKTFGQKVGSFFLLNKKTSILIGIIFLVIVFFLIFILPSTNYPVGTVISIEKGEGLQSIAISLKEEDVIKSVFIFRSTVIALGGEKRIQAGDYLLPKKESSLFLAYRMINGFFDLPTIKITIPEGWNSRNITSYLHSQMIEFDRNTFLQLAKQNEGYLSPDTYFISPTAKPKDIIKRMRDNFDFKIYSIKNDIDKSGKNLKEIVIMASILEGEALPPDRPIVSGILWKRLKAEMPLQVDSPFAYILNKESNELTIDDLKINSPYNTYTNKGLPIGPIDNPGLDALIASVKPVNSPYWYFLTDNSGQIHYAKTFEEHKANKLKYLHK